VIDLPLPSDYKQRISATTTQHKKVTMINFIIWIIVGGVLGLLLAPLFGTGTINQNDFSLSGLLVSLLGAIILLAIVNLFRRGTVR
jgi:uncharacterized membrane protein YeaQ/YmgE (transglycosylase-associated protein family)